MKRLFAATLTCIITSLLFAGTYGGGNGSITTPYLISQPEHLVEIGHTPADWCMRFRMTNDLDMSAFNADTYTPIGIPNQYFTGMFDGSGYVIRNFTFTPAAPAYGVGIFGYIMLGTVQNLGMENTRIDCPGNNIGALAGGVTFGTIHNCWSVGSVTGGDTANSLGGLIGQVENTSVTHCWTAGTVTAGTSPQKVGGLIGSFLSGALSDCYSSCTVAAGGSSLYIGGLVGRQHKDTILRCYTSGRVSGYRYIGGLVGSSSVPYQPIDAIADCVSSAQVSVISLGECGGGLVGYAEIGTLRNCSATGAVTGGDSARYLGGLIGWQLFADTLDCFSTGSVTGGVNNKYLGGFAGGLASVGAYNCFASGSVTADGGTSCMMLGGFAGNQDQGITANCFSGGSVTPQTGGKHVGGFIGYFGNNSGTVDKCFSSGPVTGTEYVGGFIGYKSTVCTVTASFWDKDASGQLTSAAGKGKITADMQTETTFTSAGWDFVNETANGTDDLWKMNGYPDLTCRPSIAIEGTLAAALVPNRTAQLVFDIVSRDGAPFDWTLTGHENCPFIDSVHPLSGSITGPADRSTVTLTLNSAALLPADYLCPLTIASASETVAALVTLRVFNRIDLPEFAGLADHWQTAGCVTGMPCKSFDWYVDGRIDLTDLAMLTTAWLGEDIPKVHPVLEDFFESGDFTALPWQHSGDLGWSVTASDAFAGSFCAQAGPINDSQTSSLELTVDTTGWEIDAVDFAVHCSTESGYDYLRFFIDGAEIDNWSGEVNWQTRSYNITPGPHTFKWTYTKDSESASGADTAWLDSVRIYKK